MSRGVRAIPCSVWNAPWFHQGLGQPSMPWATYSKLSPECQLYCRYLVLGPDDEPPEWQPPSFGAEEGQGASLVKQTVAKI